MKVKVCAEIACPELVEKGTYCPAHARKPWAGRDRTKSTGLSGTAGQGEAGTHEARGHLPSCGQAGATVPDHVVTLAEGGADHEDNMRPAHPDCHRAKTAIGPRRA